MIGQIRPGDVLLTRNSEEVGNPSPGHWNHTAICVGDEKIVEAQAAPFNEVILSDWSEFYGRYPELMILRPKEDLAEMVPAAVELVGKKYRKLASFFRRLRGWKRGENCVSVVRKAYRDAAGYDPKWKKPDELLESGLFNVVGQKFHP